MNQASPKWLHISDLHAGKDSFGNELLAKNLIAFLKKQKTENDFEPDLFFFTGDIADKGKPNQYSVFNETFLLPLLDLYGDSIDQRMFFVPGNHDVDRSVNPLIFPYPLPEKHPTLLDNTADALALRSGLTERFSAFQKALPATNDLVSLFGINAHFVRTLTIHGVNIGILGINTSWLCYSDHDKGQLTPGRYPIQLGLDALAGCDVRIVLGHHPTNWFREDDCSAINALFARHNVIYLHGHLHENLPAYYPHGADEYLNMQTGAIFDARESTKRPNTVIFAEILNKQRILSLESFKWNPSNQEWALSSDGMPEKFRAQGASRWEFPYPRSKTTTSNIIKERIVAQFPTGWLSISRVAVNKWTEATLTAQQVLSFFDGRPPTWADAASIIIPFREAVGEIVNDVLAGLSNNGASVLLISGPSGEGKSTVLRQICCAVLRREPDTKLLYRNDDEADLLSDFVLNGLEQDKPWFIVADEASNLAQTIYFQAQILARNANRRIVFLLATRDTDWIAKDARTLRWESVCNFKNYLMRGIHIRDATAVVQAWGQYGKPGLQKLAGYSVEDGAKLLVEHSQLEEEPTESAFLGAMLRVRYGKQLQGHIDNVLERLQQREFRVGHSLLEAFAAIVAMHKLGLKILTKAILARYLDIKETDIRRLIINPLGDEAVVSSGGNILLTRHRAIADATYTLLETKYNYDFSDVYKALVSSALTIRSEGRYLPLAGKWRYASRNLKDAGLHDIALQVAETAVHIDPTNTFLVVHLASLQRESGYLDLALNTFRSSRIEATDNRAFFREWGLAEQQDDNHFAAIWIILYALRDIREAKDVTNDDASMTFSLVINAARSIHKKYNLPEFLELAIIAYTLAMKLPLVAAEKERLKAAIAGIPAMEQTKMNSAEMIERLHVISIVAQRRAQGTSAFLPSNLYGFNSLNLLVTATRKTYSQSD